VKKSWLVSQFIVALNEAGNRSGTEEGERLPLETATEQRSEDLTDH
jgi:hypothetical protein